MQKMLIVLLFIGCTKAPIPEPEPIVFSNIWSFDSLEFADEFDTVPIYSADSIDVLEASGGVQASFDENAVWMINDSGNPPTIYLVSTITGKTIHALALEGVSNIDWEDVAAYEDQNGQRWLYIADVGDNFALRDSVTIYTFQEPQWADMDTTLLLESFSPVALTIENFAYENGSRDAEAFLVDPLDGAWYVINKRTQNNALYKVDRSNGTANKLGQFSLYLTTAADMRQTHPDTTMIVARTYDHIVCWKRHSAETLAAAMARTPELLPYNHFEAQGESIWIRKDGSYATVSEAKSGLLSRVAAYPLQ